MTASLRRPAVVGTAVAVVLVLAWWQLMWQPQSTALAAAHVQDQQQTTDLYSAGQTLGHLKHLQTISAQLGGLEQTLGAAVPASDGLDQFLLSLNALAQSDGITVASVSPGQPSASGGVSTIPVGLSISGTYAGIQGFLEALRSGSRLVVVDRLSESPSSGTGASGAISATITAHLLSGLAPPRPIVGGR